VTLARVFAVGGAGALALGCSLLNGDDPCEGVSGREHLVNQHAELDEGFSQAPRFAPLEDGTKLLAFDAQSTDLSVATVRIAQLGASGSSLLVCSNKELDFLISAKDHFAFGATAVPVEAPSERPYARALVGWTERLGTGSSETRMLLRYVTGGGCPYADAGAFDAFGRPARAGTLGWSSTRHAALAVMQDDASVWASWVGSSSPPMQLASGNPNAPAGIAIRDFPAVAFAPNGNALVAWFDTLEGFRTLLLGPTGEALGGPTSAGVSARGDAEHDVSCAVSAGPDRFALVASAAPTDGAAPLVFLREFSFDGEPLGAARRVDTEDHRAQVMPNAAYLPSGTLFVTWHSAAKAGTVGRFFRPDGAPRFCALGCDERPFVLGNRAGGSVGASGSALSGEEVWVVHVGRDAIGTGIHLWQAPFDALYPTGD